MDKENPVLLINSGEKSGQRWTIERELITIGRGSECDLLLPERQISRQHVRIRHAGEQYILEDLESKNGTWINEQQIKGERILHDGDEISLSKAVNLTFFVSEATAPMQIPSAEVRSNGLRLDREARRVFLGSRELDPPLSLPQYRLLELLFDLKGSICTREQVISIVWPDVISDGVSEQAIDALVRRLRDRLGELDSSRQFIVTVRGHGFRLDNA